MLKEFFYLNFIVDTYLTFSFVGSVTTLIVLHASNSAQSSNQRVAGNRVPLNVFRFHVFKQCQSILNASTTVAITVFPRSDNNRFTSFSSPQFHSSTTSSDTEVNL
jgi:hypothetical protein